MQTILSTQPGLRSGLKAVFTNPVCQLLILFGLLGWSQQSQAQTVIAGYDVSGVTMATSKTLAASTTGTGVIVTPLTQGTGVTGNNAIRGFGGTGWTQNTANAAINADKYLTFTVQATTGNILSLSAINPFSYRISGTGPPSGVVQYSINGAAFTTIVSPVTFNTATAGSSLTPIDLHSITALQNLPSTTVVTFRIVPYNATNGGGTWYIYDTGGNTNSDLAVTGTVSACSSITTTLAGTTTICAGNDATLTATISGGTSPYSLTLSRGASGTFVESGYFSGNPITVSPNNTRTYNIIAATDANACPVTTINPSPATVTVVTPVTANAGTPQTIASGGVASLSANSPGSTGTGVWSIASGPSSATSQFSSTTNPTATFTPAGGVGSYVLTWTITNLPCAPTSSNVTITVTPAICGTINVPGDYSTIQAAINAACSGALIRVGAGTYTEQLTITKSLSIVGAGVGSTTIKAPAGALAVGGPVEAGYTKQNIVEIKGTSAVTMSGLTVQGTVDGTTYGCGTDAFGIYVYDNSTLVLTNAAIIDARLTDPSLFGCQVGFAIGIGLTGSPGSATLTNVTMSGYQKGGILARGSGSVLTADNITVTGVGATTATAQNGVQISSDAAGTITNSAITNNNYTPIGNDYTASGVITYNSGVVTISNTSFTGNDVGLDAEGTGTTNVNNNTFSGNEFASIFTDQMMTVNSIGNTFDHQVTNNNQAGTIYSTIQNAVDNATSGNVLIAASGTFIENVTIPKSLTLLGANSGINPNTGSRVAETIIVPAANSADPDNGTSVVFQLSNTSTNVMLDGLLINGDNPALSGGVSINGADINAIAGVSGFGFDVNGLTVQNSIIQNFTGDGIDLGGAQGLVSTHQFLNNKFDNIAGQATTTGSGQAIYIGDNAYTTVANNVMSRVIVGVQTGNFYRASASGTPTIVNNTISAYRIGIFHNLQYQSATGFAIQGNTISADASLSGVVPNAGLRLYSIQTGVPAVATNNTINSGFQYGVYAWNTPSTGNVSVNGGSVQGALAGIRAINTNNFGDGAVKLTVNGVVITNSPVGVLVVDDPAAAAGVSSSVIVTNNTQITGTGAFTAIAISGSDASASITGNASSFVGNGSGTGVDINGGSATVFQNRITNFTTGISVSNGGVLNASSENFIKSNTDGIAYTSTAGQGLLSGNDLSGNTNKSITNSAPGFINTSCNYYGAGTDPTIYVTGNVITSRFLSDGTDTQTGTPGFQGNGAACVCSGPGGTTVAVTNVNTGANYCTIQSAVDAATAGDVINVSGTFDELVTVNKSLTIVGVGATHTLTYTGPAIVIPNPVSPGGTTPTLFKVTATDVTIQNLTMNVDLSKIRSAIHTSGIATNLAVIGNTITPSGTPGNNYGIRNAIAINPNLTNNGYIYSAGFAGVVVKGNTVNPNATGILNSFRAAVQMDLSGGTIGGNTAADGNTFTSINHDVNVRFSNNGPVTIQNNTSLGGGIQFAEPNAGAGLITIANNSLTGANVQPSTGVLQTGALMRIQNKSAAITLNVTNNSFADYRWAMSVENFNNITLDGNTFTPRANSTDYRSISFNTKLLASSSATVTPVNIGATLTNNIFNGSGTTGGTAIAFFNHRQDGTTPAIGSFTLGTAGSENSFNAGIATFLRLDNSTGPSSAFSSPFGDYTVAGAPSTMMNYWKPDLYAVNNKFDVGSGLKLATNLTSADRAALAGQLFDKNDDSNVGRIIFYTPVQNITQNTSFPTIQSAVDAAAPGDVISVQAGTYAENVTIPKSLTLLGANSGINPNTGSRGAETIVIPAVAAATDASATGAGPFNVFTLSAANIVIDGFTLDGDNPNLSDPTNSATINGANIDASAGVSGYGAVVTGGAVRNNIIRNFTFDGIDFGSDAGPTFNTIENNSFDNIAYVSATTGSGQAVVVFNNAYGSITANRMTRVSVGVQTNNNYQHTSTGTPTISGNTISTYDVGIFHNLQYQNATGTTITGNSITADASMAATLGATPFAGLLLYSIDNAVAATFSNNTVGSGFDYGVDGFNLPSPNVSVNGGSVQGAIAGVRARNYSGSYGEGITRLTVSGVSISNSPVGVLSFDNPSATSTAGTFVTVTNNTQITGAGAFTAIAISGADASASITGNASSFVGNGSGTGVDVNGGSASVMADRITTFATGINVSNGGQLTGVMNSSVVNNTNGIVYAADANATQGIVTINDLSGNTGKAIINGLASTTINANCNWFGPASATINPTYVTGNVSTTMTLANNTDEDGTAAGFQNTSCFTIPAAPVLTVSAPTNPQGGSYNATYCIGENPTVTTNYTTGTNSFTVQALSSGSTTVTTGNSVIINQGAGTYYVYATNTQNGYTSPVSNTYVQIQPEVTSFTSDKAAYCVGETVSLTALGCNVATASQPNLYFVRLRQLDGSNNENQGTAGLPSGATSYTYTQFATASVTAYTITAECVNGGTGQVCSATSLVITANPLPVATLSSSNTLTCATPTATLSASGGQSYVFDGPGIVSQSGTSTALVNASGTYSVTVTSAAGCVSTTSTTVFSDTALPTATLASSNSLNCAVTSATLTASASGGSSYSYAFSSGATQIGATNQATISTGGTYTVTVTSANGCTATATTTVTSDTATPAAPVLTASTPARNPGGPNESYCIGENPTVTSNYTTGTNSFTVADLTTGSTTVSTGNSVTITQGPGTYFVTATNTSSGSCTSPVSATTTIKIQPVVTSFVSDKAAYCVGETVSLTALGCNVATSPVPGLYKTLLRALDGSNNENQGTAFLPTGATSYTYTQFATTTTTSYTITAECVNVGTGAVCGRTQLIITANPLPVATLSSSNTLTCATPTATLTAGGGQTYLFDGPGVVSQNGSATALVNASGVYSVTVTSAAGCVSTTSTTVSSDTAVPTATLMSSNSLNCSVTSATLTATAGGGSGYSYAFSSGATQIGATNEATVSTGGSYSVTVTSANGCSVVATTSVTSDTATPTATLISGTLTCSVTSTTLTATGGVSYAFSGPGVVSSDPTAGTAVVNQPGMYTVTVTGANGCTATTTTTVTSDTATPAAPVLTASAPADPQGGSYNATYCIGENPVVTSSYTTGTNSFTVADLTTGNTTITTGNSVTITQGAGTYFVTATNTQPNGCTSPVSATTTIQVQPVVTTFTSSKAAYCVGETVSLTALGCNVATASQPNLYFVRLRQLDGSNNLNQGTAGLPSGATSYTYTQFATASVTAYTITAECVNGGTGQVCGTTSLVITANPLPVATLSSSNTLTCATPTATLSASGGQSYVFDGPGVVSQSGNTALVNASGVYSVTVTSAAGCVSTTTTTVSSDTAVPTATLASSNSLNCAVTSATLTANASGGSGYTYAFSAGATQLGATNQATVSTGGSYSVTVTSANGCSVVATTTVISDTAVPAATLVSSNTLTCAVTSATLTASGGVSYAFSGPGVVSQSGNTAVVNAAGIYSVTATALNGCMSTTTTSVNSDTTTPTAGLAVSGTLTCSLTSVTLTASGGVSYAFSGPGVVSQSGNMAIVNVSGSYSVTVTGANGCSSMTATTVSSNTTAPTATLTSLGSSTLTCTQTSVTLVASGGTGYVFSGPNVVSQSGNTAVVNASGSYSVVVTGANGCSSVTATTVYSDTATPTATLTTLGSSTITCNQPSVTLVAGGGVSYVFSGTGIVSQDPSGTAVVNARDVYSVTATAANGCTDVAKARVYRDAAKPVATLTTVGSATLTCTQTSVTLTASATGSSSYTYVFESGATQISANQATVSTAGLYSVTVTGANGCTDVATVRVYRDTGKPTATLTALNSSTLTCNQPSVTLVAGGGVSYVFSGAGIVSQDPSGTAVVNARDVYSVTATAANGCTDVATIRIFNDMAKPTASLATLGGATITCNQPSVTLTAGATGSSSYTYTFSAGATPVGPNQATVTTPGLYSVTVTGANGCTDIATQRVTRDVARPTASLTGTTTICAGGTANLVATVSGGTTPYSLTYSNGVSTSSISNYTSGTNIPVSPTSTSTYTIAVSGANGCPATITGSGATVTVSPSPNATLTTLGSSTLTCTQTSVTLTASGGTSYVFTGPGITSRSGNTAVVSTAGTYSVTVTNATGCSAVSTTVVSADTTPPVATLTALGSSTLTCTQTSVTLAAGGGVSYTFSGPGIVSQSGNTAIVNMSGTYSVTATATNGCTSTTTTSVSSNTTAPAATLTTLGSSTLTCAQTSVTLVASGGVSYAFSGPGIVSQSGNTAVVNSSGSYTVLVTGANGCQASSTTTVSADTSTPTATLVVSGTISCTRTSVTLTAGGGVSYVFGGPGVVSQSGNQAVVNVAGTYSVTATNANGCKAISTTYVSGDTTPPVASLASSNSLNCSITSTTLTATGGNTYAFSGPGLVSSNPTAGTAVANAPGTYTVTVTSANGCSATATTPVSQDNTAPTASLVSSGSLSCTQTSVTLTAGGGVSYAFSSGAAQIGSSNQAVVNASGTYSVTVTGANGCAAVASVGVSQDNTAPTASLVSSGSLSCTQTSVTLTAGGGVSYAFSSGAAQIGSSNQAVVNASGTYSVTVTGANGCAAVASVGVSGNSTAPTASLVSSGSLSCAQTSVTLTAGGGVSYAFSSGAAQIGSSNQAVVNASGTYSVTVTGANGCAAVASVGVSGNSTAPTASLVSSGSLSCAQTSVTLTAGGGVSYAFSSGAAQIGSSNQAVVNASGTYSVTVTGANGCAAVASVGVSGNSTAPTASLVSSGSLSCAQTSVTLTAGGGVSYAFSSGAAQIGSSNQAVVNASGTYSVTVTGANGCAAVASVGVSGNSTAPTASLVSSGSLSCAQTSVTLTAGGGVSYAFSSGAAQIGSSNQAVVNASGTYSVTVTGANGCAAVASVGVSGNSTAPTASLVSSGSLSCTQTSVTLTAGGGVSYAFSSGAAQIGSSNQAVVNASGTYSVTVTGANGCAAVASVGVSGNSTAPTASLVSSGSLSCAQTSVTLTAGGGVSYAFSSGAAQIGSSNQAVVNASGTYSVTVTGANGCAAVASVGVSGNSTAPTASLVSSGSLSCTQTSVTLTAGGGVSYAFSSGAAQIGSSNQAVVNASGTYSVTVTGANGCAAVASVGVSQDNTAPTASLVSSGSLSCTQTSVTLTAGGGVSYAFSSGAAQIGSSNQAVVNASGTYSVTVTGANGCAAVASVGVSGNSTAPTASLVSSGSLSCTQTSVTLTAGGGVSYAFSSGAAQIGSSNQAVVNASGTYSVTVTGANGCAAVASVGVSGNSTAPTASLVSSGSLSCAQTSVTLTAGGGVSYAFSSGAAQIGSSNQAVVNASGTYSVTVTGANGCAAVASVGVSGNSTAPTASLVSSGSLSCAQTSVTLTAGGGVSYAFSSGAAQIGSSNQAVVNASGTYSVTVTGANGCAAVASVGVSGNSTAPTASLVSSGSLSCAQTSVTLTAGGGVSYAFSSGAAQIGSSNQAVVNASGTYSVTVTGANGCAAVASVGVSGNSTAPTASLVSSGSLSCAQTSVTLTAGGGVSYAFSSGAAQIGSSNQAVVNASGTYSVTVTGANGCAAVASVGVSQDNTAPTASITGSLTVVPGGTTTLTASGGGSYLWSTGQTTASISATAGTYSVTVTSANGCFATASATVTTVAPANTPPTVANAVSPQSATVGVGYTLSIASTFTDAETPNMLTLSAAGLPAGLSLNGTTISGSPSTTVGSPFSVTLTATDPGGLSGYTVFTLTVSPAASVTSTAPFAITGVTTIDCTPVANRINVTFTPQYGGLNGSPVSFSVVNELAATTNPGPYSLALYPDNPRITLFAVQSGVTSTFVYDWLAACGNTTPTPGNTPPTVVNAVGPQSATVGVGYTLSLANTFTDAETPGRLVLSASGLPDGLSLSGTTISGSPTTASGSPFNVVITATDPGGLSVSMMFSLAVSPTMSVTTSAPFAITNVTTLDCSPVGNQINLSFTPQYAGLNGQVITFSVVNELAPTTSPAPYTLRVYSDNKVLTLQAVQSGVTSTFSYNWFAACNSGGNPTPGNTPPTVANGVSPQSGTVGVGYTLSLANTFTDAQTPGSLVLTASGLPSGLSLNGTTISGTPGSTVGNPFSVTLTATDPNGLSAYTVFTFTVSPAGSTQPPVSNACGSPANTIGQPLQALAPTYDCATGAIKFNTTGGDGSPVSFSAIGITGPTTNCNQFVDRETRTMADAPPIQITATQNGVTVTYSFNIRAQCPVGSRQAASESAIELSVRVLGNPTPVEAVNIEIRGGEGQSLVLKTIDSRGRIVSEQTVTNAKVVESQTIQVGSTAGVYILQVSTPTKAVMTKILKR